MARKPSPATIFRRQAALWKKMAEQSLDAKDNPEAVDWCKKMGAACEDLAKLFSKKSVDP